MASRSSRTGSVPRRRSWNGSLSGSASTRRDRPDLEQRVRQALLLVVEAFDDPRSLAERFPDGQRRERQDAMERPVPVERRRPRGLARGDEKDGLSVEALLLVDPDAHDGIGWVLLLPRRDAEAGAGP